MTDVSGISGTVTLHTDTEKLNSFFNQFIPDFEAGRITYDEIKEAVIDNLKEFVSFEFGELTKTECSE